MMLRLTKINRDVPSDVPGEDDEVSYETETVPVTINTNAVRCFYPRRNGRPGTRFTFIDGGGFAVTESYEEVEARLVGSTEVSRWGNPL